MPSPPPHELPVFAVGQVYETRSACDHDCIFSYTVVTRTPAFITLDGLFGVGRVRVRTGPHGEWAMPQGQYSMCPVIWASQPGKIER